MTQFLDEVQLQKRAPSIFATGGSIKTSDRYGFIPTIEVVRGLRKNGFVPVMAGQSNSRLEHKKHFCKHIMRFRHESALMNKDLTPEIVLVNSHDRSTSYQLRAGIYRTVCANGMIVGDEVFCRRIKHSGYVIDRVVEAANDLIEIVPMSVRKAEEWKEVILLPEHKEAFSEAAATLKWQEDSLPVDPRKLLVPKRIQDEKDDLWTTFNVVQENIIRGGIRYRNENGQRNRTREVQSVGENVRLNTALWMLTEKMAELVK